MYLIVSYFMCPGQLLLPSNFCSNAEKLFNILCPTSQLHKSHIVSLRVLPSSPWISSILPQANN